MLSASSGSSTTARRRPKRPVTRAAAAGRGRPLYRWGNPRAYRNGSKTEQRLFNQHNVHWIRHGLPGEGHILVFNNGSGRPGGDSSSVDELVLPVDSQGQYARNRRGPYGPTQAVWSYSAPKKSDFYSFFISGAQRLPNGNTLICSGASGTVFEVTPDKQVVWKYTNPVMGNPGGPGGPGAPPGGVDLLPLFVPTSSTWLRIRTSRSTTSRRRSVGNSIRRSTTPRRSRSERSTRPDRRASRPSPFPASSSRSSTLTALKPTAEQQKQLDDLQKEVDAKFDNLLSADQKNRLKEARDNIGRGGPPGGGPPPGGAGGAAQKGQGGPPRGPGGPIAGNTLFRASRFGVDFPGLAGKPLKPGKTIEELEALKKKANETKKSAETAKK